MYFLSFLIKVLMYFLVSYAPIGWFCWLRSENRTRTLHLPHWSISIFKKLDKSIGCWLANGIADLARVVDGEGASTDVNGNPTRPKWWCTSWSFYLLVRFIPSLCVQYCPMPIFKYMIHSISQPNVWRKGKLFYDGLEVSTHVTLRLRYLLSSTSKFFEWSRGVEYRFTDSWIWIIYK